MVTGAGRLFRLWVVGSALLAAAVGCGGDGGNDTAAPPPAEGRPLQDKPLEEFRTRLLEVALEAASALPVNPHIKDRSLAQEKVVTACLQLDQPLRAERAIREIGNWRRGAGFADLALYCARQGHVDRARRCLGLAEEIAELPADQQWRRDVIRVKVAQAYLWLGEGEKAARFGAGVGPAERGKVHAVAAMRCEEEDFQEQLQALGGLIASEHFDIRRNALSSATRLYDRFYDDPERRRGVEEKIRASLRTVPLQIAIRLVMAMAESALDHQDRDHALALVDEAQEMKGLASWPLDYDVPLAARLAALRFRAGDGDRARADADAALAQYKEGRGGLLDIFRPGAIRPLAEAYQTMGEKTGARQAYALVLNDGALNPNQRPRCEALSATCVSMALHAFEPDEEMWSRIREIREGLVSPW